MGAVDARRGATARGRLAIPTKIRQHGKAPSASRLWALLFWRDRMQGWSVGCVAVGYLGIQNGFGKESLRRIAIIIP
jgi:hypothetical protein